MLNAVREQPSNEALSNYLEQWAAAQRCCEPANRRIADEGVRLAYATAGLNPPERIVWCGGPLEITDALKRVRPTDRVGSSVKAQVFDQVRQQVGFFAEV